MDKSAINTALSRSLTGLLSSQNTRMINTRFGGENTRALIRDFKSFAKDVSNYQEYAGINQEQNNVPPLKQFLLALSTKDFSANHWPNNRAKLAFRMISELPGVGLESSMSEDAKFKINEARALIKESRLSNKVDEYLGKINHDYLYEAWKIIQAKVSVDSLNASYSDDFEVRAAELKASGQSMGTLTAIENLMSSPENFDVDGLMSHLSSLQSPFEKYAPLNPTSEPFKASDNSGDVPDELKESLNKVYRWSVKSDALTDIASKVKGLPSYAFEDYQLVLLGVHGYSPEQLSGKLTEAKKSVEGVIDSFVSDKALNYKARQVLDDVHSNVSEFIAYERKPVAEQKVSPLSMGMT